MAQESTIQVNFGRSMPLFPLDLPALFPQQVIPLHVFEPRYRQMVEHVLDGSGQLALAVFEGDRWKQEYHGRPPVRPAVCVAQIVQHERLEDGRYNLLLQGICRARISFELPAEEEVLYRRAMLEPIGLETDETTLTPSRARFDQMLSEGPLTQLRLARPLLERVRNGQIPSSAIVELLGHALVTDRERRYALLADPDAARRAGLVEHEMTHLSDLLRRAAAQRPQEWPKGCSWN
jgi:Lon protease-like protein